jgi:hydroxymethylbilane synthase
MLVIGSRGSQLALWQAQWIAARLAERGHQTRIEIIKTTGDKITDVPLAKVGTKGLFTKEIEEALLDGRIDLAIHSLKDLPTEIPAGLTMAAVPERADARDAMVGARLSELPAGCAIAGGATGSGDRIRSRQSGYARAQAGRRPVPGDRARRRRNVATWMGAPHCRDPLCGGDVPGGWAGGAGR